MFKTEVESFREQLKRCSYAVERSAVRPMLSNFLLSLEGSKLTITASTGDLYITDSCEVEKSGDASDRQLTVSAEKLMATVRHAAPLDEVSVTLDGDQLKVHTGHADYSLSTMPASEFPSPDDEELKLLAEIKVSESEMRRMIYNVSFAMAEGNHRYYLNGMLWSFDGDGIVGVSTNGHRLALDSIKADAGSEARQAIVPRGAISHLQSLLGGSEEPVTIELFGAPGDHKPPGDASRVRVSFRSTVLATQLISAKYPDHERVIPKAHDNIVVIGRTPFRDALRRIGGFADRSDKDYVITGNFGESELTLSCKNKESDSTDVVAISRHDGAPLELNFSGTYLEQVLNILEQDEIVISLKDATSSVLIVPSEESPTFKYVVMPVRH